MPSINVAVKDKARLDKLKKRPDGIREEESYASVVHRIIDIAEGVKPA